MPTTIKGFSTKNPEDMEKMKQMVMDNMNLKPVNSPEGQALLAKMKANAPKKKPVKKSVKKKPTKTRCAGKTKAGKPCDNYSVGKSKYCNIHKR